MFPAQSQKEGHLRSLMNYIDTQTECIVVAGGDGTLMEVHVYTLMLDLRAHFTAFCRFLLD